MERILKSFFGFNENGAFLLKKPPVGLGGFLFTANSVP